MQIMIFDEGQEELFPLTLTRSSCDIKVAGVSLFDACKRYAESVSVSLRPEIQKVFGKYEKKLSGDLVFLNSRVVPDLAELSKLDKLARNTIVKEGDTIIAARLPASRYKAKGDAVEALNKLKLKASKFSLKLFNHPWDLIRYNMELMKKNLSELSKGYSELEPNVYVGDNVIVHPSAVLDSSKGVIIIGSGTKIGPLCVVQGPSYIGSDCVLNAHTYLGGQNTIGDVCKLGGEIEASCMQSYSNKQHFGFLGHSYVGSWVNMGAGTTNSDLKNTYGMIKMKFNRQAFETNMQFLGTMIADYAKTAINSTIMTGVVIGAASHTYGTVTEQVPSFTNYARDLGSVTEFFFDSALNIQGRMFSRRDVKQLDAHKDVLRIAFELTSEERRKEGVTKTRLLFR